MKLYQTVVLVFFVVLGACAPKVNRIDLSGIWQVKLDSTNIGKKENWAGSELEGVEISLPGTLDDAEIGTPNKLEPAINNYVMSNLTRRHQYIGKAWYQKVIEIPKDWKDKSVTLSLERVLWESTVYIDGKMIGKANSLIGIHSFDIPNSLPVGKHLLTICIDNSNKYPNINVSGTRYPEKINQDMAHAYTNHTQIKWNGIIGDIFLNASNKNKPDNIQVYPKKDINGLKVTFEQPISVDGKVDVNIKTLNGEEIYSRQLEATKVSNNKFTIEIDKPESVELWDEFNPNIYKVSVKTNTGTISTTFGYKVVGNDDGDLTLNNKRIFLRGNLECVIFPLTGYPPMQKEDWATLIKQAKDYGLNHLRFHSWCPPKAAFEAADEAGFYLQVELPHWSLKVGEDQTTNTFLKAEADKIIKDYGNHPSFIFMAMGNELEGDAAFLNNLAKDLKQKDDRHLYTTTAFSFQRPMGTRPEPADEYFVTQWTNKGWIRGQGIFNDKPPHFNADYTFGAEHIEVPLISHEIGQYSVYPDITEIDKYTGVLNPLNFIAVKQDLENKGLLDLAEDFTYNSGKLAALLYKEEIERALKTPSFDGFQLLQLQDFPGQGTALVGLLNAFWESKGVITAEEFNQFNSELVPLLRFEKAVYESDETFEALIEVANFFKPLDNQTLNWSISDEAGTVLANSQLQDINLSIGNNTKLGEIVFDFNIKSAKKLKVEVSLEGTKYKNSWNVWVYPKQLKTSKNEIIVTSSINKAELALAKGKKVLFNPDYNKLAGIEGRFVPVFWSPVHFPNQPATMGITVDNKHPVFNDFPTDTHTNWQWWDLCINSKSLNIDSLNVKPLVRVIDNFVTNHSLASVFEAQVGEGTLIFCSIDITTDLENRPVARQLRFSLLNYMESENFLPENLIEKNDLYRFFSPLEQKEFNAQDIYEE